MLYSYLYSFLDISINTIIISSKKVIEGSCLLTNYIINKYNDMNKNRCLMIEETTKNTEVYLNQENTKLPSYNNTIQIISLEHLDTIKNQINQQSKIIDELKTILETSININK